MTREQVEASLRSWRIVTPILLMILTGIMTFTATTVSAYLGQISSSVQSIGADLKSFTKETTGNINNLSTRVSVLETKVK